MDPLSITVSVIAIGGAIKTTGRTITALRNLRDGPTELKRLLIETVELHDILLHISSAIDGFRENNAYAENTHQCRTIEWIGEQLKNANDSIIELDRIGQLCSKTSSSGQNECSRWKWRQNRAKATTLLSDLQSIRGKLLSSLAIINLSSTIRLENSTRDIVFGQQQAAQVLSNLVEQMAAHTSPIRIATLATQGITEEHARGQSESGGSTAQPGAQTTNIPIESSIEVDQAQTSVPTLARSPQDFHFAKDGQPAYQGKQCSLWCSCVCHSRKTFIMQSPLGTLSGYVSGLHLLTRRCIEHSCRCPTNPSGRIVYRFPDWVWDRLFIMTMKSSPVCGPEINIRFQRVVTPSKLYLFALHGDAKGVKNLFSEGVATPWDVNERGSSALYFAAISGDASLCRFLIAQGADPQFENQYHTSPVSLAWERILSNQVKPDQAAEFAVSFGHLDYIKTLQFKPLHKAVLGLVPLPLEPLLDCSTSDINVQDREGRTSLSWATTRDDIDSSRLLLEHGADVNKADNRGFSPIHSTKSLPSLKLLLEHKANIMSKTEAGATALHFASRTGRDDLINPMVKADADPNASDGIDTPLICSTYDHQPKSTDALLRLGADPNLAAKGSGFRAIHFAVIDNQHDIIKQLLTHEAQSTCKADKERNIIHLAAIHADATTMNILGDRGLTGVEADARDSLGKTAQEYLDERSEESAPDVVKDAFATLLDSVSSAGTSQKDEGPSREVFYDAVEQMI